MTKEKTALVIPNAIQVWTETEKVSYILLLYCAVYLISM